MYRPKFEGGTIEQRLLADYNFINQVRRVPVPDGIKMTVNGMLQSGDPEQVLAATRFLDRVDEIPGNKAEVVVSKQNRAFAGQLVQYMNAGIPGDEAYTLAQKYIREDAAERIAVRTKQIKKSLMKIFRNGLKRQLDSNPVIADLQMPESNTKFY